MTIYDHELEAYRREIDQCHDETHDAFAAVQAGANLTHFSMGLSNRANMILVGMCALVECLLTEVAQDAEKCTAFRLSDIRGMGRKRLEIFLTRTRMLDFHRLKQWPRYGKLYDVRNVIVHKHGGLVSDAKMSEFKIILSELNMNTILVDKRIRMNHSSLIDSHATMRALVSEILDELSINKVAMQQSARLDSNIIPGEMTWI